MTKNIAKKRHSELKSEITSHDFYYHVLDKPKISDFEYDQLYQELLALEERYSDFDRIDSPTLRVGAKPLEQFLKSEHRLPMLSLANSYSEEELFAFNKRVCKHLGREEIVEYYCEPKFDGLAIELVYEDGILVRALTRGDGIVGEDVTQNIRTIRSIALRLHTPTPPKVVEIRGEVLLFKNDFLELNNQQDDRGLPVFANPRNAAAGTIRQLDSSVAAGRPLRFYAYALGATEGFFPTTQKQLEDQFALWGLPVVGGFHGKDLRGVQSGIDSVVGFYHDMEKLRPSLPFDIDGIVVKVNSMQYQIDLGLVARSPRWATAAKYKPQQAETKIEMIQIQVGRTGTLTPVAVMTPVKVGGVTITHATLHNQDELERKDVRIGDTVFVQRAGDVIPEIVSVVLDRRPKDSAPFHMPNRCPVCSEPVQKLEGEVAIRCTNPFCPAVLKESLKHFVGRRAMNMDKVGDRLIESLFDAGMVKSYSDLYHLTEKDLLTLDRQGEKSVRNIADSIAKSKSTSLARFIFALGIRFVGEQTAKLLADHFGELEKFLVATKDELLAVAEIGPTVAESILLATQNKALRKEVEALVGLGIKLAPPKRNLEGPLSGLCFLVSGTLPVKREEAHHFIESHGGKITSSVSSKLSFLVVGNDPGSKVERAQSLGVKIIDWSELQKLVYSK